MVRHESCLPQLNLGIMVVYLRQLLFQDSTTKGCGDNMREGCRVALGSYIAFQMPEKALSAFYAEGYHIQASASIVLPVSTTMLVMPDIMGVQSSA